MENVVFVIEKEKAENVFYISLYFRNSYVHIQL